MPQLDAYIPAGALTPDAEADLMAKVTDLLIRHEGADPTNETVRSIAWVWVHRPETVYVGGMPAEAPAVPLHRLRARGAVQRGAPPGDDGRDHRGGARRGAGRPSP